jgi:hypothetical protein
MASDPMPTAATIANPNIAFFNMILLLGPRGTSIENWGGGETTADQRTARGVGRGGQDSKLHTLCHNRSTAKMAGICGKYVEKSISSENVVDKVVVDLTAR